MKKPLVLLGLVAAGVCTSMSHAAITVTTTTSASTAAASNTDLLQTSVTTVTPVSLNHDANPSSGNDVSVLTNGTFDTSTTLTTSRIMADAGDSITYTFNLATAAQGYDIRTINVFSFWNTNALSGQSFSVSVASYNAPTTFTTLYTVLAQAGNSTNRQTSAADSVSPGTVPIALNVGAIRFDFNDSIGGSTLAAYRELDVIGAASVPEPSALALLGLGCVGLMSRRRR